MKYRVSLLTLCETETTTIYRHITEVYDNGTESVQKYCGKFDGGQTNIHREESSFGTQWSVMYSKQGWKQIFQEKGRSRPLILIKFHN